MPRKSAPLALEYILMAVIADQPKHGYDLFRELKTINCIRLIWNLKQSLMYALLDKLENEELINGKIVPGESRPTRREYSLSGKGRQAYEEWLQGPVKHGREMRQDFLARLYFAGVKGSSNALTLVERQKLECQSWLTDIQKTQDELSGPENPDHFVISFRLYQIRAMLDWLDFCKKEILKRP